MRANVNSKQVAAAWDLVHRVEAGIKHHIDGQGAIAAKRAADEKTQAAELAELARLEREITDPLAAGFDVDISRRGLLRERTEARAKFLDRTRHQKFEDTDARKKLVTDTLALVDLIWAIAEPSVELDYTTVRRNAIVIGVHGYSPKTAIDTLKSRCRNFRDGSSTAVSLAREILTHRLPELPREFMTHTAVAPFAMPVEMTGAERAWLERHTDVLPVPA